MEPGVPFGLLGAVALLAVSSWIGLAAVAVIRARGRVPAPALTMTGGALVLAVVETVTATRFGTARSDLLPVARAAGLLLLAAGLYGGGLLRRRDPYDTDSFGPGSFGPGSSGRGSSGRDSFDAGRSGRSRLGGRRSLPGGPLPAVVVPLASSPPSAVLAAAAGLASVLAALRSQRDAVGLLLAAGLLLGAVAVALGPLATGAGAGALIVAILRGAGAVLVLIALLALAQVSLLGKVVAAILTGVIVTSTAAVAVVGSVVADGYGREQTTLVRAAAQGRLVGLSQTLDDARGVAAAVRRACLESPPDCTALLRAFNSSQDAFAVDVPAAGAPRLLGATGPSDDVPLLGLAAGSAVRTARAGGPQRVPDQGYPTTVRLTGATPGLALIVVVPGDRLNGQDAAGSAFVYGIRLDDRYVGSDAEAGAFRVSLLVDDTVVASTLDADQRGAVAAIAAREDVAAGLPSDGRTVAATGTSPTVHFAPLLALDGTQVGTLALSREAQAALAAQQDALAALLLTTLLVLTLAGTGALVLGRRTVEPVRRLTAAATRVAAGDLSVTTGMTGRDEVGTLSRTFDAMTGSVTSLTDDLRATAARLSTVQASMSDGLLATDGAGRVTSANPAALAMIGIEFGQAVGRQLDELVELRTADERLLLQPAASGSDPVPDADTAADLTRADGTALPVRVALTPLADGEGVVLVLRDTTREREIERMKTEFLSNVSHELRTPLTPIRGYAELLVNRPGLSADKVSSFATTIRDESLKMNRVVDLLVDVAAIEAGRVSIRPRVVRAASLIDSRLEHWRQRCPDRADDLRRRVAAGLPRVLVDPAWVGKALDELLDNAVKHTAPGTAITLVAALAPDGERVRLAVRDAGPGISAANRRTLFTSFEQVDGSATRRVGGLGLGLSFVRRIAQDAGMPLSVRSAPRRGAEFALDLPIAP